MSSARYGQSVFLTEGRQHSFYADIVVKHDPAPGESRFGLRKFESCDELKTYISDLPGAFGGGLWREVMAFLEERGIMATEGVAL